MGKFIDLSSERFGRLTIIKKEYNQGNRIYWLCRCDCGNEKTISGDKLRKGYTTSCGCYRIEKRFSIFGEASKNKVYAHYRQRAKEKRIDFFYLKMNFLNWQNKIVFIVALNLPI